MSFNYYNLPQIAKDSEFEREVKAYADRLKTSDIGSSEDVPQASNRMVALCAVGTAYNSSAHEAKNLNEINRLADKYNKVLDAHGITDDDIVNSI